MASETIWKMLGISLRHSLERSLRESLEQFCWPFKALLSWEPPQSNKTLNCSCQ